MENEGARMRRFASELLMCSTCSGFVLRMKRRRRAMDPDEEVVEVVTEADKMRDLMYAVSRDGPLQEKEPAEVTKEQWLVLRKRRLIMMETKMCPACSRSLSTEKPGPLEEDREDKAAGSKEKKSSREEACELIFPSQGGKERKKIAAEGKRSSSGLKKRKAKEGSLTKNKAKKRSSETEGSGSKEAETEHSESQEDVKMEVSESAGGNGKTKMVTMRVNKKSIDILKSHPPIKPYTFPTCDPLMQCIFARQIARYEVECEFHDYLRRQFLIRGYAEYQVEVTDDRRMTTT